MRCKCGQPALEQTFGFHDPMCKNCLKYYAEDIIELTQELENKLSKNNE